MRKADERTRKVILQSPTLVKVLVNRGSCLTYLRSIDCRSNTHTRDSAICT